jgi:hypothetical protein
MLERVPPPDFRYVGLVAGVPPSDVALAAAGASTSLAGIFLVWALPESPGLIVSAVAAGLTAIAVGRRGALRFVKRLRAAPTAMAIVPWGVLVDPDDDAPRVLRWPGVRRVEVDFVHLRDAAGTPSTAWSFVTVETERERLIGRAAGPVAIERLIAHLASYADETSLPLALDLDGEKPGAAAGIEPIAATLVARARALVSSSEGIEALSLSPSSYRDATAKEADSEAVRRLRDVLRRAPTRADARALAALVAGELEATPLVPDLLRLVTAVNPIVAAAAKAAALRLGAEPNRAGAIEEVAPFLLDEDRDALADWQAAGRAS